MQIERIQTKIYELRGTKVMLDFDLAEMYCIETAQLKRAVRRNFERFDGEDFMFELTKEELSRYHIGTLNKGRGGNIKYLPFAFTELGVSMLSSVLNSKTAIEINRNIMRTFVFIRQYALTYKDLTQKLQEIESKYDKQFNDVYDAINFLIQKDTQETEQKQRTRIGYKPDPKE